MSDWNPEYLEFARRLYTIHGLSAGQISQKLAELGFNVSRSAVIGKLTRAGVMGNVDAHTKRERWRQTTAHANHRRPATKKAIAQRSGPLLVAAPVKTGAPKRGPNSIRFLDRSHYQCAMFCEGEEGSEGYVCGEPAVKSSWCARCLRIVADPVQKRVA